MRYALINPPWTYDGSIYFGCREPHLPLEFGYAKTRLEAEGHEAEIIDGHLFGLPMETVADRVAELAPDFVVVATAPSYLFWRCPPPELRVPRAMIAALRGIDAVTVAVGPHGSTTPRVVARKLGVDIVVMGECEDVLPKLAREDRHQIAGLCLRGDDGEFRPNGGPLAASFIDLPALVWPTHWVRRHRHHHHRFDAPPAGYGAEVEASRGCPYHCSFCAKENFRDGYRRRPVETILREVDGLIGQGVEYVYFIDEIFLPNRPLLEALATRSVTFGIQTRIDLWKPEMLDLLGRAGCVSIEAGVESLSAEGRQALDKDCRISTEALTERLILAKRHVPFVQANLIESGADDRSAVSHWRDNLRDHGVWANDPVPMFAYPGTPDYRKRWGLPDDRAWERAHADYLTRYRNFSDIQDRHPLPLDTLERSAADPCRN